MMLLFTSDLHGSIQKYDTLFKKAEKLGVDVVINGGDMLPGLGIPELQDEFIRGHLKEHFAAFDSLSIHYLCYPGNDDLKMFDELFEKTCKKFDFVSCIAGCKKKIKDIEFIGMNLVVDYPFRLKDRCRMDTKDFKFPDQCGPGIFSNKNGLRIVPDWFYIAGKLPTLKEELENLPKPECMEKAVYVMHMPPSDLGLDVCSDGRKVGSKAIYDFIKSKQPMLTLHGHIHESPEMSGNWYAELGNTISIQPGQLSGLTYVIIDTDDMRMERFTGAI
jgi:uncharacterized protein